MEINCSIGKDNVIRLLERVDREGVMTFVEYLLIVPVKIRTNAVAIRFLARWDIQVIRSKARGPVKSRPGPGEDGYARFTNLLLSIPRHDPVMISRGESGLGRDNDVLEVREIRRGGVGISLNVPSDQVLVDLTQLNSTQEHTVGEMLDRLNLGDTWDRVDDLY